MLKSNIAWMKKNVPSDLKVWKGMIQDIDWSQVAAKTKLSLQRDKDRITAEFKEFAAMDTSAKIDWLMNGDRHLGYLYKKDAIAFARREWKGLKSVGYDFVGWLKIWGGMLNMVMKDPVSIMLAVFEYHWFASYLATPAVWIFITSRFNKCSGVSNTSRIKSSINLGSIHVAPIRTSISLASSSLGCTRFKASTLTAYMGSFFAKVSATSSLFRTFPLK